MPIFRPNGEGGKFSTKIRKSVAFAEGGNISNLQKSENLFQKFDEFEKSENFPLKKVGVKKVGVKKIEGKKK